MFTELMSGMECSVPFRSQMYIAPITALCTLICGETDRQCFTMAVKLCLDNYRLQHGYQLKLLQMFHSCMCALLLYRVMYMDNPEVLIHKRCRVVRLLQWSVLGPSSCILPMWQLCLGGYSVPLRDWVRHSLKRCPARADQAGPGQAEADRLSTVFSLPLELWGLAAGLSRLAVSVRGGS